MFKGKTLPNRFNTDSNFSQNMVGDTTTVVVSFAWLMVVVVVSELLGIFVGLSVIIVEATVVIWDKLVCCVLDGNKSVVVRWDLSISLVVKILVRLINCVGLFVWLIGMSVGWDVGSCVESVGKWVGDTVILGDTVGVIVGTKEG